MTVPTMSVPVAELPRWSPPISRLAFLRYRLEMRAFRRVRPTAAARRFAPRPLLVRHGDDDESIPTSDARQLAQAHGAAELSLLPGAGHRLRHDPRAVAILMGWLDRMRNL